MTRVVVLSSEVLYRNALASVLAAEEDFTVVDTFGFEGELPREISRRDASLALLDFQFGAERASIVLRDLHESIPDLRVLAMGVGDDPALVVDLVETGAHGVVSLGAGTEDLLEAVVAAMSGRMLCSPRVVCVMGARLAELSRVASLLREPESIPLTPREFEVVQVIARGLSNKEIAGELGVQPQTVKNHVHNILEKLGLRNRVQIAQYFRSDALFAGASAPKTEWRKDRPTTPLTPRTE